MFAMTILRYRVCVHVKQSWYAIAETTQGQMDGFFSQLQYKYHLEGVASVGDRLEICPQLDSRVVSGSRLRH